MNNITKLTIVGLGVTIPMGMATEANAYGLQSGATYYASTPLNLRRGEGTQYSVIKTLKTGDLVTVVSDHGEWAKVKVGSVTGFCSAKYLKKSNTSQSNNLNTLSETYYVYNADYVNVRTGASTSTPVYTILAKNTEVKVVEKRKDGWYKIIIGNKNYYILSTYLTKTKPVSQGNTLTNQTTSNKYYVDTYSLNVRKGAGTSYPIIQKVYRGSEVNVVEKRKDGWSKIAIGNTYGYVSSDYLTTSRPTTNSTTTNVSQKTSYTATTPLAKSSKNSIYNANVIFKKMNNIVVNPGETFSLLKTVGKISTENGFIYSTVISGGKYTQGVGGGACQVSTTLFNAVIKSGLTVTHRRNHSIPSSYVAKGLDAMISNYNDFTFKNTSDVPIVINAYTTSTDAVVTITASKDITNGCTFKPRVVSSLDGKTVKAYIEKFKDGKYIGLHQSFISTYR